MKSGSRITGHTTSIAMGAVHITSSGYFTMEGGEISGNKSTSNLSTASGGVRVNTSSPFIMSGGKITGNYSSFNTNDNDFPADMVFAQNSSIILSGSAEISSLIFNKADNGNHAFITIGGAFTGSIASLNLRLNNDDIDEVVKQWTGLSVITAGVGYSLSAGDIGRFGLGLFISSAASGTPDNTRPIVGAGFGIATSGIDIGKLVLVTP
jgi:hypothetical protein